MASPHPFLKDIWLDIAKHLYTYGPTERTALRYYLALTNRQLKLHSKLMKMRNIINVKDGTYYLTQEGAGRVQQTMGIIEMSQQPVVITWEECFDQAQHSA